MKAVRYFFGFLFGLGVGFSLGLLFAPESGESLQAKLRKKVEEIAEEGRRAAEQRQAQMEAEFKAAKEPKA